MNLSCGTDSSFNPAPSTLWTTTTDVKAQADTLVRTLRKRLTASEPTLTVAWALALLLVATLATF